MRNGFVLCALAVAACSSEPQDDALAPVATPTPTPNVRPSAAPTAAANTASLPATVVGTWAVEVKDCADGSGLTRVRIAPTQFRFYESVADVRGVTILPDGVIAADVTLTGEGMTEPHSYDLHVSTDGQTLKRVEGGVPDVTYTRCSG